MKKESSSTPSFISAGSVVFALGIFTALLISKFVTFSGLTQLQLNPYGLISIVSAVGTFIILARIILSRSHSDETAWFILVMLGQILFAGSEAMQRFSTDREAAIFWSHLSGAGASLLGISVFLFALTYMSTARRRPAILAPMLLWVSVVLAVFYAEGNLIFSSDPMQLSHYPWGFNNATGSAFWISYLWIILPGLISSVLLLRYSHRSENQLLKKQSFLFAMAILVPMLVGAITDGLLPILRVTSIPPLATLFELTTCIVIFYGMSRYQFFQINPAILAENVLTTMSEAVVVTRADFTVEYVNGEAKHLLGLTNEDLSHTSIHTLFSPDSWPKIHAYIQGEVTTEDDLGDVTLVSHSGKSTPVRVFISNLQEGDFHAYVFVISDISDIMESYQRLESDSIRIRHLLDESHRLEEQLKAEKSNVEHTVEVRTKELREAQAELKESDKLKTEFIMLGSHNLRTPITIMASSLEMLKETRSDEERRAFIESLDQGIKRMKDFVEDMVTIVSLEAGTGQRREPIRIVDLLDPVVTETKALAITKPSVQFQTDIRDSEATIMANGVWLRGAFRNLLSNAFKFTESGSVTLRAKISGDSYDISIVDTGIGIEAEELPKLFTKFHRGTDMYAYEYEGKGIGLYLTKLIVDQHGGSIHVESTLGAGSTFTISLPLKSPASVAPAAPTVPTA